MSKHCHHHLKTVDHWLNFYTHTAAHLQGLTQMVQIQWANSVRSWPSRTVPTQTSSPPAVAMTPNSLFGVRMGKSDSTTILKGKINCTHKAASYLSYFLYPTLSKNRSLHQKQQQRNKKPLSTFIPETMKTMCDAINAMETRCSSTRTSYQNHDRWEKTYLLYKYHSRRLWQMEMAFVDATGLQRWLLRRGSERPFLYGSS